MKDKVGKITFSKELFIETLREIEKQCEHDRKCSDAFSMILSNDYVSGYDNNWLQQQLLKILKLAMNDDLYDGWIEYFIWELDFGRTWEEGSVIVNKKDFRLKTFEDLWDLLNLEK